MAEALGIAASLVQLADVTIRTSLGLYKFFYALQKAQPEFDGYIIVLKDVHDAIQLLRKVALDSPTGPALAEVEADDRALQKLESHKTSLLIFLQAVIIIESFDENAGNVLRQVLDAHLRPFLELAMTKYETQNAARMQEFRSILDEAASRTNERLTLIDRRSNRLAKDVSKILRPGVEPQLSPRPVSQRSIAAITLSTSLTDLDSTKPPECTDYTGLIQVPTLRRNPIKVAEWSYWANIPGVGTFRIECRVHSDPGGRFSSFKIFFWPSIVLFCLRGFSLKYSNRPDREGYSALCPSLAIHPIIADSNPIWDMVACDNVLDVIARFQEQKNGPFDMDNHGNSLLMHAVENQSYKTSQFLLGQGADPTRTTACGRNALGRLVEKQILDVVIGCLNPCGCDPDDCSVLTIYDILQADEFRRVYLNFFPDDELDHSEDVSDLSDSKRISSDSDSSTYHSDSTIRQKANEGQYLACIRELALFLDSQGYSLLKRESDWKSVQGLSSALQFPLKMTLPVLQACGLSSNFYIRLGNGMETAIYDVLHALMDWDDPMDPFRANRKMTMVNLLVSGANLYEIEWANEHWADFVDDGLMTPTAYAEAAGILPEWLEALAAAGYDPGEVVSEDERRRREFRWLHGVKSSAIDIEELNSSRSTIRRRAGHATGGST
ncbi:hypothetical protein VE03_03963 [Pseudogymnoascus sp. 23342-1-I1]|nr:hypothetical protein VE03_03963 [Pseudogymnoascus sp. 23342-1-I1]